MKIFAGFFGLVVAALLGGCVAVPYYDAYPQHPYQQAAPPVQYAPPQQVAPVGCIPPYIPSWNGCTLPIWPQYRYMAPMYTGGYYSPMYVDPFLSFRFNFNFGKGGKHHGGGHRR